MTYRDMTCNHCVEHEYFWSKHERGICDMSHRQVIKVNFTLIFDSKIVSEYDQEIQQSQTAE